MPEHTDGGSALGAEWREGLALVNLRGRTDDAAFLEVAGRALGTALPVEPCRTAETAGRRIVWAGPDDWFVLDPISRPDGLVQRLRDVVSGSNTAITDVSSGYVLLRLVGRSARDVLARGCPLDLHPRAFGVGHCAGSHFFKASVWLWQTDSLPVFEVLVRRSFRAYVTLMLERCATAAEIRMITREGFEAEAVAPRHTGR